MFRHIHESSVGVNKVIESMETTSEFNFLIVFQVNDNHVLNSAIHSHAIFGCDDRHGEWVGYGLWVVVHFKFGKKI